MKFVLTGFCLLASIFAFSQKTNTVSVDSLKARYNRETLHFFKGYLSKGENGERVRLTNLKSEFAFSPEGAKEFALYKKNRNTALCILGGALSCFITSAILYKNNRNLSRSLTAGGFVLNIISLPFIIKGNKRLHHAVWLRNWDVVFH